MTRVLFAAYLLEAGLILIVAPWSAFWDRNFFATPASRRRLGPVEPLRSRRCPGSASSRPWRAWPSSPVLRSARSQKNRRPPAIEPPRRPTLRLVMRCAARSASRPARRAPRARRARAGVDLIQIRERDLDDRALVTLVRAAVAAVRGTPARVIVNDRTDVALAAGAAGVHLRADSIPAPRVRAIAGAGFLVGTFRARRRRGGRRRRRGRMRLPDLRHRVSVVQQALGHQAAGLAALGRVCARVTAPVLAIGGMSTARAPDVARAGAAGLAAIQLFATAVPILRRDGPCAADGV